MRPERIGSGACDTVGPVITQLKNSAAAIAAASEFAIKHKKDPNVILLFVAADHLILDRGFCDGLQIRAADCGGRLDNRLRGRSGDELRLHQRKIVD